MSNVLHFTPKAKHDAAANLEEFIRLAREDLTVFEEGGAWYSDKWRNGGSIVVFATKTAALGSYSFTPMAEPFKDFAKAYVRYTYSHRPVLSMALTIQALRCIEAGLLQACGRADIGLLNAAILDVCAIKCQEFYSSAEVQCNTGRVIQSIADFVRNKQLCSGLSEWKSPFKKPKILTEDIGNAGRLHRECKLPSNEVMLAIADLFAMANDTESRFFSSIFILLMVAPSRISEVLMLSTDCIQYEEDESGATQMFLRWRAAKGKGVTKKWIVPAMQDIVKAAVGRLLEISQPAREAARYSFDNPGRFMYHPGCTVDPCQAGNRALFPDEFCSAVGLRFYGNRRKSDGSPNWSRVVADKYLTKLIKDGSTSYDHLAGYVRETCAGPHWPFVDARRTVKIWDSLVLHRINEFHPKFSIKKFSWWLPSTNDVNRRLSSETGRSLFDRMGLKLLDGSTIRVTTHQLRHWLSTMSERAGMDDFTLAQWAGRARTSDNRHYDHRSPEEHLESVRGLLQIKPTPLLERIGHRQPVPYHELGVDRLGTAKATLYGMCLHDFAMAPCQKQRECMTCKEHVCIKGDHATLDRIRLLEAQTELLLEQARMAHEEGDFGADRWVDNHKWKLAHVRAMRVALEHPEIPEGEMLGIPDGHDPSPVRRVLTEIGVIVNPDIEPVVRRASPLSVK